MVVLGFDIYSVSLFSSSFSMRARSALNSPSTWSAGQIRGSDHFCDCGYGYDGPTDAQLKDMAVRRARNMLSKSCTLQDKLGDLDCAFFSVNDPYLI